MKFIKKVLFVLFISLMVLPLTVNAEGENKVNVYLFRGEGCPHCEEALEWFDGLDTTVKDKINLVQYETWHDSNNADLMKKAAKAMGDDANKLGVPYIVIGDKSFIGFTTSYQDELLSKINELYGADDVYDVMQHLDENTTKENDSKAVTIIIIFFIVAAGGVLIYYVSKSN